MKYTTLLKLGLCLAFLYGCNPIEKVGPDICPSDQFSLTVEDLVINVVSPGSSQPLEDVGNALDLTSEGLNIQSNFGEEVPWILTLSNGSQTKTFSGTGESLNVYWYGQPDKFDGRFTATFSKDDPTLKLLSSKKSFQAQFFERETGFDFPLKVKKLSKTTNEWKFTFWHNFLFNPALNENVEIFLFSPDKSGLKSLT